MHGETAVDEFFIERLMATIRCAVCGEHYEGADIRVLGHRDDLWFLSVSCPSCKSHGLIAAVIREADSEEEVSDLGDEELARFFDAKAISADDVLDMHGFLEGFGGDFSALFQQD